MNNNVNLPEKQGRKVTQETAISDVFSGGEEDFLEMETTYENRDPIPSEIPLKD
ncbi:hypothetical protein MAL08_08895 [Leptospira noguchii]|uniref:hypothetical protein n=1 Tax=Leptospira noguchii TaxID=28182 RepID=UPI001FB7A284|nr:hypothetical protein [Leptospira noguchii]UOG39358.1 hypothetical protein MAL08_08895 [Leptospira noguchii]